MEHTWMGEAWYGRVNESGTEINSQTQMQEVGVWLYY